MRGIGDEFALRVERGFQAFEQGVHRARQRTNLHRHERFVDRFERGMRLLIERVSEIGQRIELLVHDAPHDHPARQQQEQQRHHDREQELDRDAISRAHALRHFHDDRIAVRLVDAHLRRAHAQALVMGFEDVRIMDAAHARAGERQIGLAGDFVLAVADAVDQLLDRIGEHRLRERRDGHGRVDAGKLDLPGNGGGEVGERAVDDVLRVLPREPVRHQAAHQREQGQRRRKAPQQRTA